MDPTPDKIYVSRTVENRYRKLLRGCKTFLQKEDLKDLRKAFRMVWNSFPESEIASRESKMMQCMEVSTLVVEEIGLQKTSVISSLLYHSVSKEYLDAEQVRKVFGDRVAGITSDLVRMDRIETKTSSDQAENFRKLLLSLVKDVRVILIKLAERLVLMKHLEDYPEAERYGIAMDTFHLYAPVGHRLGLYKIKTEMEDLSLKHIQPEDYHNIERKLTETTAARNRFIRDFIHPIQEELTKQGFDFEIKGRTKSVYSIYNKMQKQNISFEEVYDIFAIRIILNSPPEKEKSECWRVFSIITDFYQPNPQRMRDWISVPKSNGYESLHTTVVVPGGKWVEVQIRTVRMNEIAEKGLAAHWKYKGGQGDSALDRWLSSIREALDAPETGNTDVLDSLKINLNSKEIFVFTPKGDLRKLPVGATVLDFAFDIHTDVGCNCTGAKINGKNVPIRHTLMNGDRVEILTTKNQKPKKDWLAIVQTSKAKARIRSVLREEERKNTEAGKEILQRKFKNWKIPLDDIALKKILKYLRVKSVTEAYGLIAEEKVNLPILKNILLEKEDTLHSPEKIDESTVGNMVRRPEDIGKDDYLVIDEHVSNIDYTLAKCCQPIFGDPVFGFITIEKGIKIHRQNCPNAEDLKKRYGYRIVKAKWTHSDGNAVYQADLRVTGMDDVGLISRITDVLSKDAQIKMRSLSVQTSNNLFEGTLSIFVKDANQLDAVILKIKKIKGIINVERSGI